VRVNVAKPYTQLFRRCFVKLPIYILNIWSFIMLLASFLRLIQLVFALLLIILPILLLLLIRATKLLVHYASASSHSHSSVAEWLVNRFTLSQL
jgi:hypothetical protein